MEIIVPFAFLGARKCHQNPGHKPAGNGKLSLTAIKGLDQSTKAVYLAVWVFLILRGKLDFSIVFYLMEISTFWDIEN